MLPTLTFLIISPVTSAIVTCLLVFIRFNAFSVVNLNLALAIIVLCIYAIKAFFLNIYSNIQITSIASDSPHYIY